MQWMFLYFPEDKTDYVPAVLEFAVFFLLCIVVYFMFVRISKKQELRTKALEEQVLQQRQAERATHMDN
ncbi:MAG: hypothetical protein KIG60_07330 [Caryophanon sp.]|nr:hypothetical protein [Caryophanon sp.]